MAERGEPMTPDEVLLWLADRGGKHDQRGRHISADVLIKTGDGDMPAIQFSGELRFWRDISPDATSAIGDISKLFGIEAEQMNIGWYRIGEALIDIGLLAHLTARELHQDEVEIELAEGVRLRLSDIIPPSAWVEQDEPA